MPVLLTGRDDQDVFRDIAVAIQVANDPPTLYSYRGQLVEIAAGNGSGPQIKEVTPIRLRRWGMEESGRVQCQRGGGAGPPPTMIMIPLAHAQSYCCAESEWEKLPHLRGMTKIPLMRADGSLLLTPGYDPSTEFYYSQPPGLSLLAVPSEPDAAAVSWARRMLLDELLVNFPFLGQADLANAVAAVISPFLRLVYDTPQPLVLIHSDNAGTGKSLLAQAIAEVHEPVSMRKLLLKNEDEIVKIITTIFKETSTVDVVFDNIKEGSVLESESLAMLATAREWKGRRLGENSEISAENDRQWILTGNSLATGGDLARRVMWIDIRAEVANPYDRPPTMFKWNPLTEKFIRPYRGQLQSAILLLARAWHMAGRPGPAAGTPPMGDFAPWVHTVGGILNFAGIEGFLANAATKRAEADEREVVGGSILELIYDTYGTDWIHALSIAESILKALAAGEELLLPDEIARRVTAFTDPNLLTRSLGQWFKANLGRTMGARHLYIERKYDAHAKVWTYRVMERASL